MSARVTPGAGQPVLAYLPRGVVKRRSRYAYPRRVTWRQIHAPVLQTLSWPIRWIRGTKHIPLTGAIHAVSAGVASLTLTLTPADTSRGWSDGGRRRSATSLVLTSSGRTDSAEPAVNAAQHELHSFFIQTYHLKDALIKETSIAAATIEAAVTDSPDLALLADLANLDKHGRLNRPPRSGTLPQIGIPQGIDDGVVPGWRLSLPIQHGAVTLDGLDVARHAVQAWEQAFRQWGLI